MAGRTPARKASKSPAGGREAGSAGVATPRSRKGEPSYVSSAPGRGLRGSGYRIPVGWPGLVNVTFKPPDKNTRGSSSHGVRGAGRRYRGRHSVNSVSVGRRHDRAVWSRVLGLWKVDRPERLAVQREKGHAGAHVHGRRRILSRESVCAVGLPVQKCGRPRPDFGSLHRNHIRVVARTDLDYRRELLHWLAARLRRDDALRKEGGPLIRADHV